MLLFAPNIEKLEEKRNVKGLIKALQYKRNSTKDKHYRVREEAADALGRIGDPQAVEPLLVALKDKDWSVCRAAAAALGQFGDARAVEPLIEILKANYKWKVKHIMKRGLRPYGERDSVLEALVRIGSPAVEPFLAAFGDQYEREFALEDRHAREFVICDLEAIGAPAVELLTATLTGWPDAGEYAAKALGKLNWQPSGSESKVAYLIAKQEWGKLVRVGASAVEPLIALLKHFDWKVRDGAAEALGKLGDARAVEPLIVVLKGQYGTAAVARALGQIGDVRAVEPLVAVINRYGKSTRTATAEALIKMYRSGKLDDAHKRLILAQRDTITQKHRDGFNHEDNPNAYSSDCRHSDSKDHYDTGIGVNFPLGQ